MNRLPVLHLDPSTQLHLLQMDDAAPIFALIDSQRCYLGKWLPFVAFTQSIADTQAFVSSVVNAPKEKFEYVFTIRVQDEVVGIIGFKDTDAYNRKTEIGYWLSEDYQKQGIVTRAVEQLCQFAFEDLQLNRIQIRCAIDNLPSKQIPQRLGFHFEGIERAGELLTGGFYTDLEVYSRLKSDQ